MFIFINIIISASIAILATVAGYNYIPLSFIERFGPKSEPTLGATITTIAASDTIRDSRAVINTNFANLNSDKIEVATTSIGNITTLPGLTSAAALATIGTITTGVWNGTALTVTYGGTGSTTLSSNRVLLGNGTGIMKNVVDGTSGQFLTNQGVGTAPTWTTSSVDQALDYTWTGNHIFTRATTTNATTTILYANSAYISSSTISSTTVGTLNATSSITSRGDLTSYGAFHSVGTATSTFGNGIQLTAGCFRDNTGACLAGGYEIITATVADVDQIDETGAATASCSAGKKVIGGGGILSDIVGTSHHEMYQSQPVTTGSGWTMGVVCNGGATCGTGASTVYAICINQ